jgi:hypothetical protein
MEVSRGDLRIEVRPLRDLQRVDDFIDIDPFVSSNPLKERLHKSLIQFILNRERQPLKPRNHCFQSNMVANLRGKMIVPMPAKARDHAVRR